MLNGLFKEEYTQPNLTLPYQNDRFEPNEKDKKQSIPITELPTKIVEDNH